MPKWAFSWLPLMFPLLSWPIDDDKVGWVTVDFVDLVKVSKSDCIVESSTFVRCAGALRVNALSRTWVRGNGARIEFQDTRPGGGGIVLNSARDVLISNIEIGWLGGGARDPLLPGVQRIQSLGNVAACTAGAKGGVLAFDLPLEGVVPLGAVSDWDDAKGWPWYRSAPDRAEIYFPHDTIMSVSAGRSGCLPQLDGWAGRRVLVRHALYTNHAFVCSSCENVTVEKVRVTSAPGMAFEFGQRGSHLTLRGDVVEPKCSPRCALPEPSVAADGAHFAGVAGEILLEENDFGWQGDDSVNITGLLVPASVNTTKASSLLTDEQWRSRLSSMSIGDKLLLYDRGLSPLGEAYILGMNLSIGRIEVSSLPTNARDLLLVPENGVPRHVVIRNNHFHDHRARGILMGGSDALIENNVIERVTMEAILVPADTGPWFEGPGAHHVRIESNNISDVNRYPDLADYPSAISAGVSLGKGYTVAVGTPIQDILVQGNSITNVHTNAENPVSIGRGVSGAQIQPAGYER